MKVKQWIALGITIVLTGLLSYYSVWGTVRASKKPLPEPAPLTAWLPTGAEILPADAVRPGTFSVTLTLGEFMRRFPYGGLVSFPPEPGSGVDQNYLIVLWHPGEGGLFYRTTQEIRTYIWPSDVPVGEVRLEHGKLIAYPRQHRSALPALAVTIFVSIAGGIGVWGLRR